MTGTRPHLTSTPRRGRRLAEAAREGWAEAALGDREAIGDQESFCLLVDSETLSSRPHFSAYER